MKKRIPIRKLTITIKRNLLLMKRSIRNYEMKKPRLFNYASELLSNKIYALKTHLKRKELEAKREGMIRYHFRAKEEMSNIHDLDKLSHEEEDLGRAMNYMEEINEKIQKLDTQQVLIMSHSFNVAHYSPEFDEDGVNKYWERASYSQYGHPRDLMLKKEEIRRLKSIIRKEKKEKYELFITLFPLLIGLAGAVAALLALL